ncbi:nicotinate phosphoribosyltransferase [Malassezia nana]|uniref:Nicotinate phosphoribosyltransferase n=1 Tax=Malassezia nana TaxID=180528 RepID=A0AAF0EPA6_9BASI|nr:nicotinate phosphoribosyltransferase [Malassezia nana]
MPHAPPPPDTPAGDYIRTASTGNKISRRCSIYGAANIVLGGKCLIEHRATLRGDLTRATRAQGSGSSVALMTGRYVCVGDGCVLRPPAKTYQGVFSYFPMRMGDYVRIGAHSIVEAAQIGSHVDIGANCIIGRFCIVRDGAQIQDGAVLAPHTVVPSHCVFAGSPARRVGTLPESFVESHESATMTLIALSSLLDTDLYKLTMQQAVLQNFPTAEVTYRLTNRSPKALCTRACVDAIQESIDHLGTLRFYQDEIDWLRITCPYFREPYLCFLAHFQLRPAEQVRLTYTPVTDTHGKLELEIMGLWRDVILYEVPLMAIISEAYFALCETDWTLEGQRERAYAKGQKLFQHGIQLSEFGTRRRRSFATQDAVVAGLLQAHREVSESGAPGVGRLLGTSNVFLARKYGIAPNGTIAHEWTMGIAALQGYDHSNRLALELWDQVYSPPAFTPTNPSNNLTIALTDTFSTKVFWDDLLSDERGIEILRTWRGLRQDSGDSAAFVEHAVAMYRKLGIDPATKLIVFSDGLNVERCLELQQLAKKHGILAGFGIGTHMTNDFVRLSDGGPSPALNLVIKLYSINGHHAVKISDDLTKNTGDKDEVAMVKRRFGLDGSTHIEDA